MDSVFALKWIRLNGLTHRILCQNENGPCPLLAIANVLILQGKLTLATAADGNSITAPNLVETLANYLIEQIPASPAGIDAGDDSSEQLRRRQTEQVQCVMELLPVLLRGLDVNVRFGDVDAFEFTAELSVFDAFAVRLFHGWVLDPTAAEDAEVMDAVRGMSYNELVNRLCSGEEEKEEEVEVEEGGREREGAAPAEGFGVASSLEVAHRAMDGVEADRVIVNSSDPQEPPAHAAAASANAPASPAAPMEDAVLVGASSGEPSTLVEVGSHGDGTEGAVAVEGALAGQVQSVSEPPSAAVRDPASSASAAGDAPRPKPLRLTAAERAHERSVIQGFLEGTANQLTYYGLIRLLHPEGVHMREGQLAVLFRNNHFSVMLRRDGQIYLLVTDEGFNSSGAGGGDSGGAGAAAGGDPLQVVWEHLRDIHGDTEYVNCHFVRPAMQNCAPQTAMAPSPASAPASAFTAAAYASAIPGQLGRPAPYPGAVSVPTVAPAEVRVPQQVQQVQAPVLPLDDTMSPLHVADAPGSGGGAARNNSSSSRGQPTHTGAEAGAEGEGGVGGDLSGMFSADELRAMREQEEAFFRNKHQQGQQQLQQQGAGQRRGQGQGQDLPGVYRSGPTGHQPPPYRPPPPPSKDGCTVS